MATFKVFIKVKLLKWREDFFYKRGEEQEEEFKQFFFNVLQITFTFPFFFNVY